MSSDESFRSGTRPSRGINCAVINGLLENTRFSSSAHQAASACSSTSSPSSTIASSAVNGTRMRIVLALVPQERRISPLS